MTPTIAARLAAAALLALSAACDEAPPAEDVARLITSDPRFTSPKTVRLPRRIVVAPRAASSYSDLQIPAEELARLDWVAQSLGQVQVVNVVDRTAHSTAGRDLYHHYIDVHPVPESLRSGDFTEDDEAVETSPWSTASKEPGWKVAVARRRFERVSEVLDHDATTETIHRGQAVAYFEFTWVPTKSGFAYDQATYEFASLPRPAWSAARVLDIDSRVKQTARAILFRDREGRWYVRGFECRRCGTF